VGKLVDPDDLVDSSEAAEILGLGGGKSVSVYRKRYPDFPAPVIERARAVFWLRRDIERWAREHRR
jgi:predicted DNA-binding transcriptional regulator AlpA